MTVSNKPNKCVQQSLHQQFPANMTHTGVTALLAVSSILSITNLIQIIACSKPVGQDAVAPMWLSNIKPEIPVSERLSELLSRVGPNIRSSSEYFDFKDIDLNDSREAWSLMHATAEHFAKEQVHYFKPRILQFAREANVSSACQSAIESSLNLMSRLDSGAVKMWSATGNFPPVGLFDGQLHDLGSYRGCVDSLPNNGSKYTAYCTISARPVTPKRPPFHMTFHEIPRSVLEKNSTSDIIGELRRRAQYFYYMYLKTGVCVPFECSPVDIQKAASLAFRRLGLMSGPVKCFTKAPQDKITVHYESELIFGSIENQPLLIELTAPMNTKQVIAASVIAAFYMLVILATLWHWLDYLLRARETVSQMQNHELDHEEPAIEKPVELTGLKHVAFSYFSMITNGREFLDTSMRSNEIKCLHGMRVFTMLWIILVHSLQYNDWSGFSRVFENVATLQNPAIHPLINANYVVENFFFMSGLLAAYKTWFDNKGTAYNFSFITSLMGRYLRLTPQVLLVSLLYILLPLAGDGPFWYDMSEHASKYCQRNWWINLLHLQSFYKEEEICNLVSWWISIDMCFYVISLFVIYLILKSKTQLALALTSSFVGYCTCCAAYRHFVGGYTPNNLGLAPQMAEVWTGYVVNFFWSPYTHAYPFFLGLWVGHILANNKWRHQVRKWSRLGWCIALTSMLLVNLSSHIWISGMIEVGNQYISTAYNIVCAIIWSTGFAWVIVACHYGTAPKLNKFLSAEYLVLLSKASFIIYLSHMLIVRLYFGLQYTLIEVSMLSFTFSFIGITVLSTIFGIFLCISFEGSSLKFQRQFRKLAQPSKQLDWKGPTPMDQIFIEQTKKSIVVS